MAVWGDRRRRAGVFAALLCLAALLAVATLRADAATKHPGPDQTRLILRFSDLVLGYINFDFGEGEERPIFCSQLTHPEDTPPKLKRFVLRFHPRGCISAFFQLFAPPGEEPGPRFIGTGVMALGSDRAADAAWRVVPILLSRLLGDRPLEEVHPEIKLGSATRQFQATLRGEARFFGRHTSFLVWRSGNTLAVIETFGPKIGKNGRDAAQLAPLQQAHIETPTRYTGAERYDAEVPLDDPALKQPVYWLGRNFAPTGLSPIHLKRAETFESQANNEKTGKETQLWYESQDQEYEHMVLEEWDPRQWKIFQKSKLSHTLVSWHCTETRTVQLSEGTATIYAGYRRDYRKCPAEPPTSFTARASLPGVFVTVEKPFSPHFANPRGTYNSYEALENIVAGLVLRPKRTD
jgi:hypothetical protein